MTADLFCCQWNDSLIGYSARDAMKQVGDWTGFKQFNRGVVWQVMFAGTNTCQCAIELWKSSFATRKCSFDLREQKFVQDQFEASKIHSFKRARCIERGQFEQIQSF